MVTATTSPTQAPVRTLTATEMPTATQGPVTLQVWLPPNFDPAADTPAAKLLAARLQEFTSRRPGVRLNLRVKALDGPGGLLDSLTTASAAAPLALPDLIALPRPMLEVAALKGLLHPYDALGEVLEDPDWYEYGRQMARLQNSAFGLPFAGDALHLVYRPQSVPAPPRDLPGLLGLQTPVVFPAADPQALLTLALYQSAGGATLDGQGRPNLDPAPLEGVLALYGQGSKSDIFPVWLTQVGTDEQAWNAFLEGRSNIVITWTSRYLNNLPADAQVALLPTRDGTPFTLATGWVWALAGAHPDRMGPAAELAQFLTESDFLSAWTAAAGYLPPRSSAQAGWSAPESRYSQFPQLIPVIDEISRSAQLFPPSDVMVSLGPALQGATVEVIKQQAEPGNAAKQAVDQVASP